MNPPSSMDSGCMVTVTHGVDSARRRVVVMSYSNSDGGTTTSHIVPVSCCTGCTGHSPGMEPSFMQMHPGMRMNDGVGVGNSPGMFHSPPPFANYGMQQQYQPQFYNWQQQQQWQQQQWQQQQWQQQQWQQQQWQQQHPRPGFGGGGSLVDRDDSAMPSAPVTPAAKVQRNLRPPKLRRQSAAIDLHNEAALNVASKKRSRPEPESEPQPEPQPESESEPEDDPEPAPEPEPVPVPEAAPKPRPEPKSPQKPRPESGPKPLAESLLGRRSPLEIPSHGHTSDSPARVAPSPGTFKKVRLAPNDDDGKDSQKQAAGVGFHDNPTGTRYSTTALGSAYVGEDGIPIASDRWHVKVDEHAEDDPLFLCPPPEDSGTVAEAIDVNPNDAGNFKRFWTGRAWTQLVASPTFSARYMRVLFATLSNGVKRYVDNMAFRKELAPLFGPDEVFAARWKKDIDNEVVFMACPICKSTAASQGVTRVCYDRNFPRSYCDACTLDIIAIKHFFDCMRGYMEGAPPFLAYSSLYVRGSSIRECFSQITTQLCIAQWCLSFPGVEDKIKCLSANGVFTERQKDLLVISA